MCKIIKLTMIFALTATAFGMPHSSLDPSNSNYMKAAPDVVDAMIKTAVDLYNERKYIEALEICVKAADLKPDDFRPHSLMGSIYLAQNKFKNASESLARAIKLKPNLKPLYLLKAKADRYRNDKPGALAAIRKAIEIDPMDAQAYEMLGWELRYPESTRPESIKAFRQAIKLKPTLLSAYGDLGDVLAESGDMGGAEEILRKGMELDPNHMAGRFELGRIMVNQGRLKEARELWNGRKSDTDRTIPSFISLLERAEKLQVAKGALALKPNDPETLLATGYAVLEGDSWAYDGRHEKAIALFEKALELRPNFAPAQYAIVKAYIQLASVYKDKNKIVDEGLIKLRLLDPKLATELEEYRKNYKGAITTISSGSDDQ